jgi:nicotinamidase-related amidase
MHALIVVDVQAEFNVPQDVIAKIRARADDFPVRVFTKFTNPPGSLFRKKLGSRMCSPGNPAAQLVFEPKANDLVLEKTTYGLMPQHIETVRTKGIKEFTVAGVDTDACVLAVMFSLWDNGFDCHIEPDLCWSSSGLHDPAIKIAHQQFGK